MVHIITVVVLYSCVVTHMLFLRYTQCVNFSNWDASCTLEVADHNRANTASTCFVGNLIMLLGFLSHRGTWSEVGSCPIASLCLGPVFELFLCPHPPQSAVLVYPKGGANKTP